MSKKFRRGKESKKGRQVVKWRIASPTKLHAILQVLAQDGGRPKRFSEIWGYIERYKLMGKVTFCVYLENLEKMNEIKKVVVNPQHIEYSLCIEVPDAKSSNIDLKDTQKVVDNLIKRIQNEEIQNINDFVCRIREMYERIRMKALKAILKKDVIKNGDIEVFLNVNWLNTLGAKLFNWELQVISALYGKYPKETLKALN